MANLSFEQLLAQYSTLAPLSTTDQADERPIVAQWPATDHIAGLFDQAKQYIQRAIKNADLPDAERAANLAWRLANHTQAAADLAQAHWCAGMFHANRNVRQALTHAQAALAFFQASGDAENQGRILIGIASQLNLLGRLAEAEASINAAAQLLADNDTYRDWPVIYINLSYIQCQQGNYQLAVASADHAIRLARRLSDYYPERQSIYLWQEAQALVNQGRAWLHLADFEAAQTALRQAFTLANEQAAGWIAGRAAIHLARLHGSLGQLVEGLQWAQRAQQIFQTAEIQIDLATAAIEEAHLYARLKMFYLARRAAIYAADAFAQADIPTESVEARLLAVRLSLLLQEPRRANAELLLAQPLLDHTPPLLQNVWRAYQAHYRVQSTSSLRPAYTQATQAALALVHLGAEQEAIEVEIIAAELYAALQPLQAAPRFAQLAERAHKLGIPYLEQQCYEHWAACLPPADALVPLQKAVQIISRLQRALSFEELKANLLTGHAYLYSRLVETHLALGQAEAALQTLLAAKGAVWAEGRHGQPHRLPTPAWQQARAELDFWQDEGREAVEPEFIALCQAKIAHSQHALAAAARMRLAAEQPPAINDGLPVVNELAGRLPANSVVIEFLCGAERVWACVIDARQPIRWIALGDHAAVKPLLSNVGLLLATMQRTPVEMRGLAAAGQQAAMTALLQQLYTLLWQPLAAAVTGAEVIYLVPHEYLFELPWSALWNGATYLGQTLALCLLPSAGVIATVPTTANVCDQSVSASTPTADTMLLLGHRGEPPLQFVEAELQTIAQSYPTAAVVAAATTTAFAWTQPPRYLHIAAHGQINRREPLFSCLQLADGDYLLADVLHLNLQGTRLVTLSACETSTVPEQGGVLLALAGAFLSAGAQTTVATLWKVDDQATQLFMQQFYQGLRTGLSIPHALQGAQQTLFRAGYQHPYYWAAFQPLSRQLDQPG